MTKPFVFFIQFITSLSKNIKARFLFKQKIEISNKQKHILIFIIIFLLSKTNKWILIIIISTKIRYTGFTIISHFILNIFFWAYNFIINKITKNHFQSKMVLESKTEIFVKTKNKIVLVYFVMIRLLVISFYFQIQVYTLLACILKFLNCQINI